MRSSKSRSRSKTNRPRTLGNIISRVFDSSGPEGKVRGTPQQIIEKYLFLARDAQLSNDRVAAENFLQHAEHYTRMLGEANRELAAEQETRQQYAPSNGGQNGGQNGGHNGGYTAGQNGGQNAPRDRDAARPENRPENRNDQRPEPRTEGRSDSRNDTRRDDRSAERTDTRPDYRAEFTSHRQPEHRPSERLSQPQDVIDLSSDEDLGLVETPEATEHATRRAQPRKPVEFVTDVPPKGLPAKDPSPNVHAEHPQAEPDSAQPALALPDMAEPTSAATPRAPSTRRPRSPKKPVQTAEAPAAAADQPVSTPNEAVE